MAKQRITVNDDEQKIIDTARKLAKVKAQRRTVQQNLSDLNTQIATLEDTLQALTAHQEQTVTV